MEQITRIVMDTSKHIFQLHGVTAAEEPALRKIATTQGDGDILPAVFADCDRDRSLRREPSLGASATIVRALGEVDRASARQAVTAVKYRSGESPCAPAPLSRSF